MDDAFGFSEDTSPSRLEAALSYARLGWAVLPLHTAINGLCSCGRANCSSPGKHPRTAHGVKDATTNEATIREWWQQRPDGNVGIATGAVSGLVVLDVDPRHGGQESLQQLIDAHNGDFPETVTALTGGGGGHFYFASPGGPVRNRVGLRPGLDIRGDGGYVVAPPSQHASGRRYVWEPSAHPENTPFAPLPPGLLDLIQDPAAPAGPLQDADGRWLIPEGSRHNTLVSLAGTMRRRDCSQEAITAALLLTNELQCVPPLDDAEVLGIAASIMKYPAAASPLAGDSPGVDRGPWPLTDLGNAERLVAQHGEDLLYCYLWNYWLVWNGIRWQRDLTEEVFRRAKATIRHIATEAHQTADTKRRNIILAHANWSEAAPRLKALVELARFHPPIPVLPAAFDQPPWLLNVLNGTVDLHTGILHEHRREDLLTKLAPVVYDPDATCPRWEAFLMRIMGDNVEQVAFLQRAAGYALTGDTREEVIFILYGTGANGKSTFLEVLRALLEDYARQADFTTFLTRRSDGVRNDVARLAGARFVTAVEAASGRWLDEALIKQLTGRDPVPARFLYQEYFEYYPEFKLFLATNHKPVIQGADEGIWRRIRLIPFAVTIPAAEQDRTLRATLRSELPGILNWAIQGCLAWQREGLGEAEAIQQATAAYRKEMDDLADFLEACCVPDPDAFISSRELYEVYQAWCAQNAAEPLKQTTLGRRLTDRGFLAGTTGSKKERIRRGLRLRTISDKLADVRACMGAGDGAHPVPVPGADGTPAIDPLAPAPQPEGGTATATAQGSLAPGMPESVRVPFPLASGWELPTRFEDWPSEWQQFCVAQQAALAREEELPPEEATARALALTRQDYRTLLIPRTYIADHVATDLKMDLQALSTRLGRDLRTLPEEQQTALLWRLSQSTSDWSGWSAADRRQLDAFLVRCFLEEVSHAKIRDTQRWAMFRQRTDRYGSLTIAPQFTHPLVEKAVFEHDLDLPALSARLGVNFCNVVSYKEAEDLHWRLLYGDLQALVSPQEHGGLISLLLGYKRVYESQERPTQARTPKPRSR